MEQTQKSNHKLML